MSVTSTGAQEFEQADYDEKSPSYSKSVNALFPNSPNSRYDSMAASNENLDSSASEFRKGISYGDIYTETNKIIGKNATNYDGVTLPKQKSNVSYSPNSKSVVTQHHPQSVTHLTKDSRVTLSLSEFL